jgi:hypothetical protein
MTNFYNLHIQPRLIGCACGACRTRRQRATVVPRAQRRVLELSIGRGLNLARLGTTGPEGLGRLRVRFQASPGAGQALVVCPPL